MPIERRGSAPALQALLRPVCALGLAILAVLSGGCADYRLITQPPDTAVREAGWAADEPSDSQAKKDETSKDETKKPKPRTVWQALHAYRCCLRCREWEQQDSQEDKSSGEATGSGSGTGESGSGSGSASGSGNGSGSGSGSGSTESDKDKEPEWFSAHAQATMITQIHDHFRSPYAGPNSLLPSEPSATSLTATLYLAARLWENDENSGTVVFNPEITGGTGFSGVTGLAGFSNGEIQHLGTPEPRPYIARLFVQETIGLGGEQEKLEDDANQIAGTRDVDRLTLFLGKMAAEDLADNNKYSHDPRTQFLDWSLMYNGAWDYPANVRGYTFGLGLDFNQKWWAFRYGIFLEPATAQGAAFDPHVIEALGQVAELEERWERDCHPGKLRLLAFLNHANMGNYRDALAMMPVNPDITATRRYRIKYGFGLNLEQELCKDLGFFARLGWNDGHSESWAFTEIDETASAGLALKGRRWCRPNDTIGVAYVANGLSSAHRDYLASGGLGFIIGDGALNYAAEEIVETYYDFQIKKGIDVTVNFQGVEHPAYNADRGPLAVFSLRVHVEF